jgi:hypothetical protein
MLSGRGASSFPAEEDCSCSICLSVLVDPVVGKKHTLLRFMPSTSSVSAAPAHTVMWPCQLLVLTYPCSHCSCSKASTALSKATIILDTATPFDVQAGVVTSFAGSASSAARRSQTRACHARSAVLPLQHPQQSSKYASGIKILLSACCQTGLLSGGWS